ncbi:MAG: AAA family ATPase, partial [Desulfobacterales bacterium]|nr:AAA family ATPase [Desulfobacterales bacterium]
MLDEYEIIEEIDTGTSAVLFKGKRTIDHRPVMIKTHKNRFPAVDEIDSYFREFEIGKEIVDKHVVQYLDLVPWGNGKALILKDFGAECVKRYVKHHKAELADILKISIRIASCLESVHGHGIVHKYIRPESILINPGTKEVKLGNFNMAFRVLKTSGGAQPQPAFNVMEGTLAYISPEETGRMNRFVDFRTDLYSLGICLYEWFTGQLPFESDDVMEMVHCHLAKEPVLPEQVNKHLPPPVSNIIIKLLAKSPEDRYQSARSLRLDLEVCLRQLQETGRIERFVLGIADVSERLHIPEKLYGRDGEIQILKEACERVSQGQTEVMMVAGYAGVGKSLLVHEVQKTLGLGKGLFISGKFEQFNKNIAYSAISKAFQGLVEKILCQGPQQIEMWRNQLLDVFGPNGQVILDVIPGIELITGKQPPVAELGFAESQNRFHTVFGNFIRVFAKKEHPLIMFLDDLQWADVASLNLMKGMVTNEGAPLTFFCLIGAYRDNEVFDDHPAALMIKEICDLGLPVEHMTLPPIGPGDVRSWIGDILQCEPSFSESIADLVYHKTGGNPFFIRTFLQALYEDKLIRQNRHSQWEWDIKAIAQMQTSDNVAEFLAMKLHQLPSAVQDMMTTAACVGTAADMGTLALVTDSSREKVMGRLEPALSIGLLIQTGESLKFAHDRVQEVAYSLKGEDDRLALHLQIGKRLLVNQSGSVGQERLFETIDHLNRAHHLILDSEHRIELVRLNLEAGIRAKASLAYNAARRYLDTAQTLLPDEAWETLHDLAFSLNKERAVLAYLTGDFDWADAHYAFLMEKAGSDLERADVYIIQLDQYQLVGRLADVISTGKRALAMLGIVIPDSEEDLTDFVAKQCALVDLNRKDRAAAEIADGSQVRDEKLIKMMHIINNMMLSTFFFGQQLLQAALAAVQTNLSLTRGNNKLSSFGYVNFGWYLVTVLDEIKKGEAYGRLAMEVMNRFDDKSTASRTLSFDQIFLSHWREHISHKPPMFETGFKWALESGDQNFQSVNLYWKTATPFLQGKNLEQVYADAIKTYEHMTRTGSAIADIFLPGVIQAILSLQGFTLHPASLSSEDFDEDETWKRLGQVPIIAAWLYASKLRALFFYGYYRDVVTLFSRFAQADAELTAHQVLHTELYLYNALAFTALWDKATETEKYEWQQILDRFIAKMRKWAEICPENYAQQYLLVAAELARIQGDMSTAMDSYEKAIETAKRNEFTHIEALANETYAKLWMGRKNFQIARVYIEKAYSLYRRWGAWGKVRDLEQKYPTLLREIAIRKESKDPMAGKGRAPAGEMDGLDETTVVKAARAISSEISRDSLLSTMMNIIIESAGAQRGFLVLESKGKLQVEALASVDQENIELLLPMPIKGCELLSEAIVRYVNQTGSHVVLHHACKEGKFFQEAYIQDHSVKSVICSPFEYRGRKYGALYLENNLTSHVFTEGRVKLLQVLLAQAVISLENAELFEKHVHAEEKWRTLVETITDW